MQYTLCVAHIRNLISLVASLVLAVVFGIATVAFLDYSRGAVNTGNSVSTANDAADLSINKTNNLTQVVAGTQVIYTTTISNLSNTLITNAVFLDTPTANYTPQQLRVFGANAATQGITLVAGQLISFLVSFGPGGFLNVVVTGTLSSDATGTLTNTAKITPPADVTDPNPANNIAIDADPIVAPGTPMADIQISTTDFVTQVKSGQALSYTVMVTNAGPQTMNGVQISDVLPSEFQASTASASYRSATQRAFGFPTPGVMTATYDMLPGGLVVIVVNGVVRPTALMNLTNTVAVAVPAIAIDPDSTNNGAIDVDELIILRRTFLPLVNK